MQDLVWQNPACISSTFRDPPRRAQNTSDISCSYRSGMETAMAAATDDERLAVRHLPVRRQERKKEKGRKKVNAISFCHPLSAFAENP